MTTSTYKHHEQKLINPNSMEKQNETTRAKKGSQQKQESQGGSAEFQILPDQLHEESC